MLQDLAMFTQQLIHQALAGILVTVAIRYVYRLLSIKDEEPRTHLLTINLGTVHAAVGITIGGTHQVLESLHDTDNDSRGS